jgi:two-component system, chemotaxis family, chemotaxis protein CheY
MSYSILVVDDSILIRQAVKMALELSRLPVQVVHAACDGEAAMEVLRREYVDLVFLDLNMPKKDGFEVLKDLRASTEWRRMSVVVVSTEVNREAEELKRLGIQGFVVKPFRPEAISQIAHQVLVGKADS